MASKAFLEKAYLAYFGRPVDYTGAVDYAASSEAEVIASFSSSPESQSLYGATFGTAQINAIYNMLFGRDAEPAGLDYWYGQVKSGAVTPAGAAVAILEGAQNADAVAITNKLAASSAFTAALDTTPEIVGYAGDAAAAAARVFLQTVEATPATQAAIDAAVATTVSGAGPAPGVTTFTLSNGLDVAAGTAGADTFYGNVGQNSQGAISNALATGDRVDGGAGVDAIRVSMINDNEVGDDNGSAPRPITDNVEQIYVESLETSTLDATRMVGVEQYWSDFSRGDLTITGINLRGTNVDITKDVTFGIRDTMDTTDFRALFDSLSLTRAAATSSNSQVLIRIADVSTETPATPLLNVNVNLGFTLGAQTYALTDIRSADGSYAGLVTAIEDALALKGLSGLTVALSTPYSTVTFAGNTVTLPFIAQEVLVTDPAGTAFSAVTFTQSAIAPVAGGFLVAGNATPVDPSSTSNLIESNLVLDNAGNGSLAGDVVIGGMSNSSLGVEQINVTVDRDSKILSLNTTNTKLQEIIIGSTGANGDLYIGSTQASLNQIDANAFAGESLSLGESGAVANLAFLDAAGTAADVTFDATYNGVGRPSSAQAFVAATGSGDDEITASVVGLSTSGSTLTSLSVNAGSGDNIVVLSSVNGDGLDNTAMVTTGAGADTVTGGAAFLTAETGGGNDVVYAENTGVKTVATILAGAWSTVVNTVVPVAAGVVVDASQLLYGRQVQVTLGLPGMNPAGAFTDGLEATFDIAASNGYLTTERDLYEAVANAINNDAVMSTLAFAEVDSNGHLTVQYLIDGATVAADDLVQIQVLGNWTDDLSSAEKSSIVNALKVEYQNSTITAANAEASYNDAAADDAFAVVVIGDEGTESVDAGGTNVVNGGSGNDVIVLSSDDTITATIDTVVFDGLFGSDTIVHFTAGAGGDVLDFTSYLTGLSSPSGSVESRLSIATTLNADAPVEANSVTVLTGAFTTTDTFEGLTGAKLLNAINTTGNVAYAGIADADLAALTTYVGSGVGTTLVGGIGKAVVMVENDLNEGEYAVFELTFNGLATNLTGDFTAATLIGTVDFGATAALTVANLA